MGELLKTHVKKAAKAVNAYTALQYIWLIELYYLGLNVMMGKEGILIKLFGIPKTGKDSISIPEVVLEWNAVILDTMQTYSSVICLLAISLFFWE